MSKERLTENVRNFDNSASAKESLINEDGFLNEYASKVLTKLAEYEDLEEQGLLLKLPCKVGDTVYTACAQGIESGVVSSITIMKNNICIYDRYGCFIGTSDNIFLTQSEAEEKLRELEG